jgi:hypothetical protein
MAPNGRNGRVAQRQPATTPVRSERIALYLDLENLLHEHRQAQDWDGAMVAVASLVHGLTARGTLVARVAFADARLIRRLAFDLCRLGIRSHAHEGGENAADLALLEALQYDVPTSCKTVVIASGDHIFAPAARRLREEGKRVEVVACVGTISAALYASADSFKAFITMEDGMSLLGVPEFHPGDRR